MKITFGGLISSGEKVAVALSGGKDSVALFHIMCELEASFGIQVLAINVEHGIRGEESLRDSAFVKKLCDNARKRLLCFSVDAPEYAKENKLGLEEAARELRYKCFAEAVARGFCDKIVTAHHLSDSVETVLLNICRGSGVNGLSGVPRTALNGIIVRPLIEATREQIDAYIARYGLEYVDDSSNLDDGYSRNFIRNRALPVLKEKFTDIEQSIGRLSEICAEESAFLDDLAEKLVEADGDAVKIKADAEVHPVLLKRAVVLAMKSAGLKKDYERVHVEAVRALMKKNSGASVNLPHGYVASRGYGDISIYKSVDAGFAPFAFAEGEHCVGEYILKIEKVAYPERAKKEKVAFFTQESTNGVLYVSAGSIPEGAVVRMRDEGDVFKKFGGGTKSLKEFLIDKKIERRLRDRLPVCAVGREALFVAGVEVSKPCAAEPDGEVYKISYYKENE